MQITIDFSPAPYLFDHRHGSKAVLPAVEALQLLAASAQTAFSGINVNRQEQARFDKFLFLDHLADGTISAIYNRTTSVDRQRIACTLITHNSVGRTAMSRLKEHVTVEFILNQPPGGTAPAPAALAAAPFKVPADRLYRELVPFGVAYRNISNDIALTPESAVADITAPAIVDHHWVLGSPFVLDAAFHAACAWGQRYAGLVAFPVGFHQRDIFQKTHAGQTYQAIIHPAVQYPVGGPLWFDIQLYDAKGALCERVQKVCMRDVSGGKVKPPEWVRA